MPILYTTGTIESTTLTDDIDLDRHSLTEGYWVGSTAATCTFWGRDRGFVVQPSYSSAQAQGNTWRRRWVTGEIVSSSKAVCKHFSVVPAPRAPKGKIRLEGELLHDRRLPKGKSFALEFQIYGDRLKNLQIEFKLFNLSNRLVLGKQVIVAPGGVLIEELVDHVDGNQVATGVVWILPEETKFIGSPPEFETRFSFEIGNGSSRQYLIDEGYILFTSKAK